MNCSSFDLKAHILNEATAEERRAVEQHAKSCGACREELQRLDITRTALAALPSEEIPRRIAFVSDKVFEPRWYQRWWNSAARLGFASAALLSAAILTHALTRPAVVVQQTPSAAVQPVATAPPPAVDVEAVVRKVLAESEARQARNTAALVAATEQRLDQQRREDRAAVEVTFEALSKKLGVLTRGLQTASSVNGAGQ